MTCHKYFIRYCILYVVLKAHMLMRLLTTRRGAVCVFGVVCLGWYVWGGVFGVVCLGWCVWGGVFRVMCLGWCVLW